jgi:excinuclease ABC subunit B
MADAIAETQRRRDIQMKYNEDNNITPTTIQKAIEQLISESTEEYVTKKSKKTEKTVSIIEKVTGIEDIEAIIVDLTRQMNKASVELDFELAATLRDQISELKEQVPAEK